MFSLTQAALERFDNQHDFERLAADVLHAYGCTDIILQAPRGGSDGGRDVSFSYDGGRKGLAWVTLRKDIDKKFHEDAGLRQPGEYSKYYLICTAYLTSHQKDEFARYCRKSLDADFVPQDCEALRSLLDSRLPDVKDRYLPPVEQLAPRLFQLPTAPADFTGRQDEIQTVADRLRASQGGLVGLSALCGMGGVGKTSLAVRVAHELRDLFPDAQIFLDLQGTSDRPLTSTEAITRIIRDFLPAVAGLPGTEAELLSIYRSILVGKRALILLDNAAGEAQVKALVTVSPPVGIIITSRNALALEGVASIRLDVLPADEARTLLRRIVGTKGTDDELRAVATLCGRLPLALRVAGDFLRLHENWSAPHYIRELNDENRRLEKLKGKTPDRDVEAVLSLSGRHLVRELPDLAKQWQMLSVFPSDFDEAAAAIVWDLRADGPLKVAAAIKDLTALYDRSLVQYDPKSHRYSLHDLMKPVARHACDDAITQAGDAGSAERLQMAERRFAQAYLALLTLTGELYAKGHDNVLRALALFDEEQVNIRHGQLWAKRHCGDDRGALELCRDYPGASSAVLRLRLSLQEHLEWLEACVLGCRELHDGHTEGFAAGNLGVVYTELRQFHAAIDAFTVALARAREFNDLGAECGTLGNLGMVYGALGDARAFNYFEKSLAIARNIGDRRAEANTLGDLGNTYEMLGDSAKAADAYEKQLAMARETGDRVGEALGLYNLAVALEHQGLAAEAIQRAEQSLVLLEQQMHPGADKVRQHIVLWRGKAQIP
jgi:predicted ATPase